MLASLILHRRLVLWESRACPTRAHQSLAACATWKLGLVHSGVEFPDWMFPWALVEALTLSTYDFGDSLL